MKLRLLLPILSIFLISACSDETPSSSTEKYKTLTKPMTVLPMGEVVEMFSLACGHCRSMEAEIPKIESASQTKIEKSHVTFSENASFSALIFYSAAIQTDNEIPKGLSEALFQYVQEEQSKDQSANKARLTDIFSQYQLTSPFDLDEKQQDALFAAMNRANEITMQSEVTSVPTFIVNGKYVINTAAHSSAEDIAKTITELLKK